MTVLTGHHSPPFLSFFFFFLPFSAVIDGSVSFYLCCGLVGNSTAIYLCGWFGQTSMYFWLVCLLFKS